MKRLALIGLIALLLPALLAPLPAEPPSRPVTVPFEVLPTKHLAVEVKLNGRGPYRVIFDTGAPIVILGNKAARASGVLPDNVEISRDSPFGAAGQFPIQRLEVGGLRVDKVPALVMEHPAVASLSKSGGPLEGIVGYPFFSRYRMTIDYPAKKLTLTPNGYEPEDILTVMADRMTTKKKPPPRLLDPAGIWGISVSKDSDDEDAGVNVTEVQASTAAAEAGMLQGDRLLTIDGRWTDSVPDCYLATSFVKPGSTVPVVVKRDGKEKKLMVTPRAGM